MTGVLATNWLAGSVDVPFPVVAAVVGLIILAVLVYFARRVE